MMNSSVTSSWLVRCGAATVLPLLLLAMWAPQSSCHRPSGLRRDQLPPNFHVVVEGFVYRSGQPETAQLANAIREYGIRTVINLRGSNPGQTWYDDEKRLITSNTDATMLDFSMSANRLPPPQVVGGVLGALKTAQYPILIHCSAGADRTGAISAIYRMAILGDEKKNALEELTPEYLHFRSMMPCMDALAESFDSSPDWLERYAAIATQPCPD